MTPSLTQLTSRAPSIGLARRAAALLLTCAAACSTSTAAPVGMGGAGASRASSDGGEPKSTCVAVLERARACTDHYIPALVDARARHDTPAGIAAEVASDRDAVIAQARTEWAQDSTPAAIDTTCERLAATPVDPATVSGARACLAEADCGAFTTCIMPHIEKRFSN